MVVSHTVGCMSDSGASGTPCWIFQRAAATLKVHRTMRVKPSTWGHRLR